MNVKQSKDPAVDRCRHVSMSPEMYDFMVEVLVVATPVVSGLGVDSARGMRNLVRVLKSAAGPNAYGKLQAQLTAATERADALALRCRALNRELDRVRKKQAVDRKRCHGCGHELADHDPAGGCVELGCECRGFVALPGFLLEDHTPRG